MSYILWLAQYQYSKNESVKKGYFYAPFYQSFKIRKVKNSAQLFSVSSSSEKYRNQRMENKLNDLRVEREKRDKTIEKLKLSNDSSMKVEQDILRQKKIEECKISQFMITSHLIAH